MFTELSDKERFAEQVYNKYLTSAYLVEAEFNELLIDNLFLSIEITNMGFDLNKCINETC